MLFVVLFFVVCSGKQDVFDMHTLYTQNMSFENRDGGVWKQGWPLSYSETAWSREQPLNVFVLPHSHVDAGWLKTFDEYYSQQTRQIISSVVHALASDARRHFVWADIGFFQRWWDDADDAQHAQVRALVRSGQLEFVTGAWVTTDEANARYPEMLEQVLEGHEWLRSTLGVRPRFGWSIDPFGHSPSMAYLLQRAGFDAIIINRVHYAVKKLLAENKALEFYWEQRWQPSDAAAPRDDQFFTPPFHASSQVLTHIFPFYSYDVPHTCGPEPAICCEFDFARASCPWSGHRPTPITADNVAAQAAKLVDQYRKKSLLYRSRNVMIPVGDDFRYQTPQENELMFTNYQAVFDYINANADQFHAHVRFANLSSYFESVRADLRRRSALPVVRGDFFTYADRDQDYWSGYFTSRPFYKRLGRLAEATVRAAEIVHSVTHALPELAAAEPASLRTSLVSARRTMGIYQHHDAVTGTAKTHVNDDYGRMLHRARHAMRAAMRDSINAAMCGAARRSDKLLALDEDSARDSNALPLQVPLPLDDAGRAVVFYNSLPYARREAVSVPVAFDDARAVDGAGEPVALQQLVPNWGDLSSQAAGLFRLHFVVELPALGFATYFVDRSPDAVVRRRAISVTESLGFAASESERYERAGFKIARVGRLRESEPLGALATVNSVGMLATMAVRNAAPVPIAEDFGAYVTASRESSGAYLIDPAISRFDSLISSEHAVRIVRGPVFDEALVRAATSSPLAFQRVARVYHHDSTFVQISHRFLVTAGMADRELVARFDASGALPGLRERVFYSDSNGFQMHRRDFVSKIPNSANIYPCAAEAFVADERTRLTALSPQAHAVMSFKSGQLEFILDRRTSSDDARGLVQPLNDNIETESTIRLVLEPMPAGADNGVSSAEAARIGRALEHHVHAFYASSTAPRTPASFAGFVTAQSFLVADAWPADVVLETLRVRDEATAQLVLHVRRVPTGAAAAAEFSLRAPLFAALEVVDSERYSLSMMHRDDTYRHGDAILTRSMEIECYLLTVKPRTAPLSAAPRSSSKTRASKAAPSSSSKAAPTLAHDVAALPHKRAPALNSGDAPTPCPPTGGSQTSVLYVAGAMLCLQGFLALFSLGQSRFRNALMVLVFFGTLLWVQTLIVGGSVRH